MMARTPMLENDRRDGNDLQTRVESALLASAIGDALGWPQENRSQRVGGRRGVKASLELVAWSRRAGGRWAPHEEVIRAGEYSDDTQMTLALARSFAFGERWWEHWTQVELPFWLLYERGG